MDFVAIQTSLLTDAFAIMWLLAIN